MNNNEKDKDNKKDNIKDNNKKDTYNIKKNKQNTLNNTDKITLQYMTNPLYNNLIVKDNKNANILHVKIAEKKEQIIYFKKNILNLTKKFLDNFEKDEKIKIPDNVAESFNNYLYNIIGYIEHKKTVKSVKEDLQDFENNDNSYLLDNNIEVNNINESSEINEKYINNIIQTKNNENNHLNKFVKITNLSKKEKIIPNKKNIYK